MNAKTPVILTLVALFLVGLALLAQAPATQAPAAQAAAPAQEKAQSGLQTEAAPPSGVAPVGKTRFEGTIANTGRHAVPRRLFHRGDRAVDHPGGGGGAEEDPHGERPESPAGQSLESQADRFSQDLEQHGQSPLFRPRHPGSRRPGSSAPSPVPPWAEAGGRAGDYPFGFIEMIIPNDGKGHGTIVGMAKISFAPDGTAQIEGYGTIPEKLMDVEIKKKK